MYWKHLASMQFGLDGVRSYHSGREAYDLEEGVRTFWR